MSIGGIYDKNAETWLIRSIYTTSNYHVTSFNSFSDNTNNALDSENPKPDEAFRALYKSKNGTFYCATMDATLNGGYLQTYITDSVDNGSKTFNTNSLPMCIQPKGGDVRIGCNDSNVSSSLYIYSSPTFFKTIRI